MRPEPRDVFADLIEDLLSDLGRKKGQFLRPALRVLRYHVDQHDQTTASPIAVTRSQAVTPVHCGCTYRP
ncbi:hypothetical protein T261_7056 [Streptomyces lydicus]|nr:hypothetical protein T261_7056 [Streptomyces lydicus]